MKAEFGLIVAFGGIMLLIVMARLHMEDDVHLRSSVRRRHAEKRRFQEPTPLAPPPQSYDTFVTNLITRLMKPSARYRDKLALTMQSASLLRKLQKHVEHVVDSGIAGDVYETGTWRAGTSIFMTQVFRAYERSKGLPSTRRFYFFDSFAGFRPEGIDESLDVYLSKQKYVAPLETVRASFKDFDVDMTNITFVKGFFDDTVPNFTVPGPIAVLRMDGDLYSSTKVVLDHFYDHVVPQGWVIIDDYNWRPSVSSSKLCKEAIDEFRAARHITAPLTSEYGPPSWQVVETTQDVCIITAYKEPHMKEYFEWGQYRDILPFTLGNMWTYARLHKYRVYLFNQDVFDTKKKSSWVKIPLIRRYFERGCKWVFYTDVDWLFIKQKPLPLDDAYDLIVSNECIKHHEWKKMSGTMLIKNSPWSKQFLTRWENMYDVFKSKMNHDQAAFEHMLRITPPQVKVLPPQQFMTYDTHNCPTPGFGIHFPAGNKNKRVARFANDTALNATIAGTQVMYQIPYTMRENDIIVGIVSSSREKRMTLRKLYKDEVFYFIVGEKDGFDYDEFYEYNDMILVNRPESYWGEDSILPYKTQVFFTVASRLKYEYLLKIDDDSLVKFDRLRAELKRTSPDYWGRVWRRNMINRDPKNKWYVSYKTFSEPYYPDYCSGAGYTMSRRFVDCMVKIIPTQKFMPRSDVTTGLLARACHIQPVNSNLVQHLRKYPNNDFIIRHYVDFSEWHDPFKGGGMTTNEQTLLRMYYSEGTRIFEWGMGSSTSLAAYLQKDVVAVDSAKVWVDQCRSKYPNADLRHVNIGPVADWGYPKSSTPEPRWANYSTAVQTLPAFDVYLVDGRFRVACAMQALLHNPRAKVIVHDAQRKDYDAIWNVVRVIDQTGKLKVVKARSGKESEYKRIWDEYKYVTQ